MRKKSIWIRVVRWFDRANGNSYWSARAMVWNSKGEPTLLTAHFNYGYGTNTPFRTMLDRFVATKDIPSSDRNELSRKRWSLETIDSGYKTKREMMAHGKE